MSDTRKTLHDTGILDVIKILSANGASGRLDITAGTTEGSVFFKEGQLVDARVGHLTGFPAVNAVASIRDARFNFDPSAVAPFVSSITPSERVVLKQFFGIQAFNLNDTPKEVVYSDDEVTLETSRIPVEALPTPLPETPPSSRSLHRGALVLALLFIVIAAAAVALRNMYRERTLSASVATTEQPAAPSVAEEAKTKSEEVRTTNSPASMDQPVAAQNLSGKWSVVNTVQKTSYRSFQNLKIGFDLSISQNGKSLTGTGVKISENGRSLPPSSRTPIELKGSIKGDRVEATFFEEGAVRKTNGRLVWRIEKTGGLNGTFVSTAAGASGKSAAKREL